KVAVLGLFVVSRLLLVIVDTPGSQVAGVNVVYAFEMQRAAALGLSFYEMHEQNRLEADSSSTPVERLVEYPPLALVWMAMPTWFLDPIPKYGFVPEKNIEAAKVASRAAMFVVDGCGFALLVVMGATAV